MAISEKNGQVPHCLLVAKPFLLTVLTRLFFPLQSVNNHCFTAFLNIPPAQFKLVLDSIIWAFKHTMRNVADTGLQVRYVFFNCDWVFSICLSVSGFSKENV